VKTNQRQAWKKEGRYKRRGKLKKKASFRTIDARKQEKFVESRNNRKKKGRLMNYISRGALEERQSPPKEKGAKKSLHVHGGPNGKKQQGGEGAGATVH